MGRRAIDARGLAVVLGLTLAVDLVIRPFSQRNGIRAQVFAPAALLDGLAVLALTAPLLRALTPAVRARMGAVWTRGARCAPFLVLFAFAAGGAAVRAEQFLRYVSDAPLPRMAVYALVLAAAFYAMRCGAETLARVCGVLAWLFGLSVVILLASNAGGMAIVNLETDVFDPAEWALTAARGFSLPAQIVLFFWLALGARDDLRRPYRRTLLAVILLAMVLSVAAELVLGSQAQMQNQTVHALSRLGGISVFHRLDALHTAAWLAGIFAKACAFALAARMAAEGLLPREKRAQASGWALAALLGGVLAAAAVSDRWQSRIESAACAALLLALGAGAFAAGRAYEKTKGAS